MDHAYDDILYLPHPISTRHPGMRPGDRAAQFAPFAALAGFDGLIREAGRLTDSATELDAWVLQQLDRTLQTLRRLLPERPLVRLTCFVPDPRKAGGRYAEMSGRLKAIDPHSGLLVFTDGRTVPIHQLYQLEGPLTP